MARSIGTFDIGDRVAVRLEFAVQGVLTDPTNVVVRLRSPAGLIDEVYTEASPEVVNTGVGVWVFTEDITANDPGLWVLRVEASGAVHAATEVTFFVRHSVFYS